MYFSKHHSCKSCTFLISSRIFLFFVYRAFKIKQSDCEKNERNLFNHLNYKIFLLFTKEAIKGNLVLEGVAGGFRPIRLKTKVTSDFKSSAIVLK